MILNHISERTRLIVVPASVLNIYCFGDSYLDIVDVISIPEGFKDSIRKPESQNILHRLFAQVVVDPKNLALFKVSRQVIVKSSCTFKVPAKRLFNHESAFFGIPAQAGHVHIQSNRFNKPRSYREIEYPVGLCTPLLLYLIQPVCQAVIGLFIGKVRLIVCDRLRQPLPLAAFSSSFAAIRIDCLFPEGSQPLITMVVMTPTNRCTLSLHPIIEQSIIVGGYQLSPAQIACSSEDNQNDRIRFSHRLKHHCNSLGGFYCRQE